MSVFMSFYTMVDGLFVSNLMLLREKMDDLDRNMAHLRAIRKTMSYHCQNMQTLLTMDLSEISIVRIMIAHIPGKNKGKRRIMMENQNTYDKPVTLRNGYRYYSYYQSAILETILLLRELDVPIEEIQAFMKNRSAASMKQLLREKLPPGQSHFH